MALDRRAQAAAVPPWILADAPRLRPPSRRILTTETPFSWGGERHSWPTVAALYLRRLGERESGVGRPESHGERVESLQ